MIFLRNEWSISSQYDAGRNVSERICSINIHIISDYDSITLNIGVIRNNYKQLKKEKQQLFKLRKNIHFQHYNYNTVFVWVVRQGEMKVRQPREDPKKRCISMLIVVYKFNYVFPNTQRESISPSEVPFSKSYVNLLFCDSKLLTDLR